MINKHHIAALAATICFAACTKTSGNAADTANAAAATPQTQSLQPRPRPPLRIAAPDTSASIGEIIDAPTIMREKSGGKVKPLPPRDSTFGPKVGLDTTGKATPIRQ